MTMFEFRMRATEKDPEGYYYPRWDLATPLTVIAANRNEAFEKCWAMLGETTRQRDWTWTAKIDKIIEVGEDR